MGKAGIIAQKISATFASSGISSFFLHPAEAVHGDLGRFVESDILLLLSNSGETDEILEMLPYVKRIGCHIISLCGSSDNTLAKHSDIVLSIGEHKEAGHLALAPTTSTAVMLALGDALALVVQKEMNLTREQFALYHPAGKIGRTLLEVREIMRQGEDVCIVQRDTPLRNVLHALSATKRRTGAAVVVDHVGKLCGIFTDGDFRRLLEKNDSPLDECVELHMGRNPKVITPGELAQDAMHIMSKFKIDELIVVNEKSEPIGLLDIQDIVEVNRK
jgi:arabinose-5-phosphate isomerase